MATLAISGGVIRKAGNNVSSGYTEANYTSAIEEAEATLIADTRYDWVGNWATLSGAAVGSIAKGAVENLAAMDLINYDPNVWHLATAQTKLDVLWDKYQQAVKILSDKDKVAFLVKTA